jgi:hypothetical protein
MGGARFFPFLRLKTILKKSPKTRPSRFLYSPTCYTHGVCKNKNIFVVANRSSAGARLCEPQQRIQSRMHAIDHNHQPYKRNNVKYLELGISLELGCRCLELWPERSGSAGHSSLPEGSCSAKIFFLVKRTQNEPKLQAPQTQNPEPANPFNPSTGQPFNPPPPPAN